ncbi:hypothetical protein NB554_10155 [Vibrio alginolyticus]|uniref:hypothetical protein n=1 Tax=Vibrio alginolyticus TaxID=663 RepID=UPI00215C683A|nr:hypothetical protein [Vibrio alginolyticus]MCR9884194.1 hypothetical protein [Vibrio alginolyticus]
MKIGISALCFWGVINYAYAELELTNDNWKATGQTITANASAVETNTDKKYHSINMLAIMEVGVFRFTYTEVWNHNNIKCQIAEFTKSEKSNLLIRDTYWLVNDQKVKMLSACHPDAPIGVSYIAKDMQNNLVLFSEFANTQIETVMIKSLDDDFELMFSTRSFADALAQIYKQN